MTALPLVRLKNAWKSSHPWIFQRLVEKPAQRPRPGGFSYVVAPDGVLFEFTGGPDTRPEISIPAAFSKLFQTEADWTCEKTVVRRGYQLVTV